MNSDDEFDLDIDRLSSVRGGPGRIVNGLNLREVVEKRGGAFEINTDEGRIPWEAEDDIDLRMANMIPRRRRHEKYTPAQLQEELYKDFLAQDFSKLELARKNEECGEDTSYEELARFMDNITPDGGVKKRVLLQGWGGKIQHGQVVYVDYLVTYEGGDETLRFEQVVDTTKIPERDHQPFRFKVGAGNVIPVFDLGVLSMEPHESAQFLATWKYAYGKLGLYQEVPPETTVKVEIFIKRVVDGCENLNVWELDPEERMKLPFDEKMKAANELKEYGTDHVKKEQYQLARLKYRQALQILHEIITPILDETTKINKLQYILLINIAHCKIKETEYRKAKQYLEEALSLDLPSVDKLKAYYRLALCHSELGEFEAARRNVDIAKSIDGANADIDQLYLKLHQKILRDHAAEKSYAKKMFKN